jgi:methyl-accepting chemotaxis protein
VQAETQEAVVAMEEGTNDVESGFAITVRAGDSLKEIGGIARVSAELAQDISHATQEQVRGADGVATAVQSIAGVAGETERGALATRRTVDELASLAAALTETLGRFKLPAANGDSAEPPAHNGAAHDVHAHNGEPHVHNGGRHEAGAHAAV